MKEGSSLGKDDPCWYWVARSKDNMNASDLITYMWCTTSVPFTSLVCSFGCHTLELGAVVDARDWSDGSGSKQKSQPVERGQNIIANRVGVTSFAGKYLKHVQYPGKRSSPPLPPSLLQQWLMNENYKLNVVSKSLQDTEDHDASFLGFSDSDSE